MNCKMLSIKWVIFFLFASGQLFALQPRILMHYRGMTFGGIATDLLARHKQFLEHGIVSVLLVHPGAEIIKSLKKNKLPFELVPALCDNRIEESRLLAFAIKDVCKKYKLNTIVCVSNNPVDMGAVQKVKYLIDVKVIYIEHCPVDVFYAGGLESNNLKKSSNLSRYLMRLQGVDGFVGVNEKITETISAYFKNSSLHFTTIKPFLNVGKFLNFRTEETKQQYFQRVYDLNINNETPIITMIAAFARYKQHEILVSALAKIKESTEAHIIFAGSGMTLSFIKSRVVALGLQDRVHFLGFIDDTQALLYYSEMHVLCSKIETVGLVTAEAGLMQKAVLGTLGTGLEKIILDGQTGYLFKQGDVVGLATKLQILLDNAVLCSAMGRAGKEFMEQQFSFYEVYEKTIDFISNILNQKTTRNKSLSEN